MPGKGQIFQPFSMCHKRTQLIREELVIWGTLKELQFSGHPAEIFRDLIKCFNDYPLPPTHTHTVLIGGATTHNE